MKNEHVLIVIISLQYGKWYSLISSTYFIHLLYLISYLEKMKLQDKSGKSAKRKCRYPIHETSLYLVNKPKCAAGQNLGQVFHCFHPLWSKKQTKSPQKSQVSILFSENNGLFVFWFFLQVQQTIKNVWFEIRTLSKDQSTIWTKWNWWKIWKFIRLYHHCRKWCKIANF